MPSLSYQLGLGNRPLPQLRALRREADRVAIQRAGGFPVLVALLGSGPASELTEYAVAVLGNLAAGGHALKDALRDVRARPPPIDQKCIVSLGFQDFQGLGFRGYTTSTTVLPTSQV